MEEEDYLITYLGEGHFQAKMANDELKDVGPSLRGMIRYTYFEDFQLPEIGWQVTSKKLKEDYFPKLHQDLLSGKIKAI